ncbi:hypothetical protein Taro_020455 [Colocasia esculenta]|uniref:Uncharacterized protein n=1 Tax=Colocasia esculenta TaxID=4460 RepID=A0A843UWA9_COLES|nr:hypothetical protein [Colocasia esculenta]
MSIRFLGVHGHRNLGGSENTTCVSYVHLLTTEEPLAQVQYKLEHDDSDLFECNDSKKLRK